MTVQEWLRYAEHRLRDGGIDEARTEAIVLARHILRVDRSWLIAHSDREFPELAGEPLLIRRLSHEPLAYIVGWREFFGRPFGVSPAVLIPRHETELLVETALRRFPTTEPLRVLDVGTGSGCIAITLKLERPEWEVTAIDVSEDALAIASANARFHDASLRLVHSDLFGGLLGEEFDLIVSNPPYIGMDEPLPPMVIDHEPQVALFAGESGFEFYEKLAVQAQSYLPDGGVISLEVGYQQANPVRELFETQGWTHLSTELDLAGIPRVVSFGWSHEALLRADIM